MLREGGSSTFDPSTVATMLVRTGNARIETAADVFGAADAVAAAVEQKGGYVERRSDEGGYLDEREVRRGMSASLTLRVPVVEFYAIMRLLRTGVGGTTASEVASVADAVRDVTGRLPGSTHSG